MSYIPINIKTNYELLSSLIKLDDLICFAKNKNIKALGITDTCMFSTMEFYNKCKENNIKPIIGTTINLSDNKLFLYAKSYEGYINICNIVTENNLKTLEVGYLKKHANDIICVVLTKESYDLVITIFKNVFFSYKNNEEKKTALNITNNIVFSNELLFLNKNDFEYLEYLYMIRDGETIYNHKEHDLKYNFYLENISEEDANTTKKFASLINFDFPKFDFILPSYSENSKALLYALSKKGLSKRVGDNIPEKYRKRLYYELSIIEKMGFIDYFLIVYDYILYSKKNNIVVGPGRGSAAASLVSYSLGITNIDPIKFDLIFERFLNPERITMPDIDIDFEYLRRDEVVEYVRNKYGNDKVANIITFGTLLPKQVIRDVGRILDIDLKKIDRICKNIDDRLPLNEILKKPQFIEYSKMEEYRKLFEICLKLENLKRHTSIHAAGVVISEKSLTNKMPLYKSGNNILTSFTMEYMEQLGLLKMDFLALRNLTIINNVLKSIKGENLNLNNIPLDDEKTLEIFNKVNTVGIFQFESEGMKNFLREFKINSFDDIVATIALYRPGPKEMIPLYIKRKNKIEKTEYLLSSLEPILKSTNGIIIYQEQIMEILRTIASYSYAEADNIRRAMSKKKESIIIKEKENFIKKSTMNGYDKEISEKIYELVLKFANYGFNKAHSVAYSLIAYQMAYLKAHYTNNFLVSLLNMVIGRENKIKEYISEAKILGIVFKELDINESEYFFKITDNSIIYPLSLIKGLGEASINEIVKERKKGKYINIYDFMSRTYNNGINKKVIESLINSGILSVFGYNKRTLKENLDELINYASLCKDLDESLVLKPELILYDEYEPMQLINIEFNTYGFYINNHPVTKYKRNSIKLVNIKSYFDKFIEIILLVEHKKVINTKTGDKMAFLVLSDETNKIEGVVFPNLYKVNNNIEKGNILKINGKIEKRMDSYQIVLNKIEVIE